MGVEKFIRNRICWLRRTISRKNVLFLCVLIKIIIFSYLFVYYSSDSDGYGDKPISDFNSWIKYDANEANQLNDTNGNRSENDIAHFDLQKRRCRVPKLNPWDRSIVKFVDNKKGLECPKVQPFLTFVDDHDYLRFNKTEKEILAKNEKKFSCFYRMFVHRDGADYKAVDYSASIRLIDDTKLKHDQIDVKCYFEGNSEQFYYNLHVRPIGNNIAKFKYANEHQLSVFFFIFDSVSFSAFRRKLPLTYQYTKDVMKMSYFHAFNKIGAESMPIQMPMFLGKRFMIDGSRGYQADMLSEINSHKDMYYDNWPFIWKSFAKKGYTTIFNNDAYASDLYSYRAKGFMKIPFDYSTYHYWLELSKMADEKTFCFKNTPRTRIAIELVKSQLKKMTDKLYFVFSPLQELSHDFDEIERIDEDLVNFWKELYENGRLNKTAVIFMSDHGIRFGEIRKTLIGFLEEQLPFYSLYFPPWFYAKHPRVKRSMEENKDVLTSNFDVYETLKDILNSNYDGSQRSVSSRGQSHLYPLPKNRTCQSAGIPDQFCTCFNQVPLKLIDSGVIAAAHEIVAQLNSMLLPVKEICHEIVFSKVLHAAELYFHDETLKNGVIDLDLYKSNGTDVKRKMGIDIETQPNNATFQTMVKFDKKWTVDSLIIRTSRWQGLSECVDLKYKPYCSCRVNETVLRVK